MGSLYEDAYEEAWGGRQDHDDMLELRAREESREDRLHDFAPASRSPYQRGYEELVELIEEHTKPNSALAIHAARVRREVRVGLREGVAA